MNQEDRLQDRLDRLEAGEALPPSLAQLPGDEAELLELAAALRTIVVPDREADRVAAQRATLLRAADARKASQRAPNASPKPWRSFAARLTSIPRPAALAFAAALFIVVMAGLIWLRPASPNAADAPDTRSAQLPPSESTALPFTQYVPLMSKPLVSPDLHSAVVSAARGVVEVRDENGDWSALEFGDVVGEGQHVRTGSLSSAALLFYDGSQATLGPVSEVAIDQLDARSDSPRVIQLTQTAGESDHDVSPSSLVGSRYEVRTPSGTGLAKGTSFHVLVTPDRIARFNVDEGAVSVTHLNVTVIVIAGQSTTVYADEPPTQPVFRISGEGEVTQIGDVWTIGGRDFAVDTEVGPDHSTTEIIGDPQIGDWVHVEGRILPDGTYFADRIVLLHRAEENRFAFTGQVDAIGDDEWTISGRAVGVNDETDIDEDIGVGDLVEVTGLILENGTLLAERIRLVDSAGLPFEFTGVVENIADDTWTISGVSVAVDENTEIKGEPEVGDVVKVEGHILDDGTWLAEEIKLAEEEERRFEFTGTVEQIDPWVVSGIHFDTSDATEIDDGVDVGDRVKVEGRVLEDGVWLAEEIKLLDDELRRFEFVGEVSSIDPWVVGGLDIAVDDQTDIDDDIVIGDTVRVRGIVLPDGTLLAESIERVEGDLGCSDITAIVLRIEGNRIVLSNGQTIDLGEGVAISGELRVRAVIIIRICIGEDGEITIISIIVIYQLQPPSPPAPPPGDDDDDDDSSGGKVTICHKPDRGDGQTLTVSQSALGGHLGHGDRLGPCGDDHDDDHDGHNDD